jgi:prolyl oligopeptidase
MFEVGVTYDGNYLVNQIKKDASSINLISFADIRNNKLNGKIQFTPLIENWGGQFDYIYNIGTKMYFNTNYKAPKSRVIMIDIGKKFDSKNIDRSIREVVPEHKQFIITAAFVAGKKLVIKYM